MTVSFVLNSVSSFGGLRFGFRQSGQRSLRGVAPTRQPRCEKKRPIAAGGSLPPPLPPLRPPVLAAALPAGNDLGAVLGWE